MSSEPVNPGEQGQALSEPSERLGARTSSGTVYSSSLGDAFRECLAKHAISGAEVAWQSCFGRCTQGPNVLIREIVPTSAPIAESSGFATLPGPRGVTALYNRVDASRVERLVHEHIGKRQIVRDYIERPPLVGRAEGNKDKA
jgi:(2Fe-2S) ferredoxin